MTQQQWEAKADLMQTAAIMASAICGPGAKEDTFNLQHCRCYQYLQQRAMPDETVYNSPAPVTPATPGSPGGPMLTQSALLTAIQKALADPTQAASLTASVAKLIGVVAPTTAPAANAVVAVASGVAALPVTPPTTPAV